MNIPESFYTLDIESFTTDVNRPCVVQVGICLYYKGQYATHSVAVKPIMRSATFETMHWWANQDGYKDLMRDIKRTPYREVGQALNEALNVVNHKIVRGHVLPGLSEEKSDFLGYPIRDLYGDYREDVRKEVSFKGGSHNAGYDAELQARSMVKALEVSKNG